MSYSHFRGKLITNTEIKGPFTEAADDFKGKVFNMLAAIVERDWLVEAHEPADTPNGKAIFLKFGDSEGPNHLTVIICEDGTFEVLEGGA